MHLLSLVHLVRAYLHAVCKRGGKSKGAWGSTPLAHHPSNGRLATLHEGPLCPSGYEGDPDNSSRVSSALSLSLSSTSFALFPIVARFPPPLLSLLSLFFFLSPRSFSALGTRCKIHSRSEPDYAYRTVLRLWPRNPFVVSKVRLRVSWKRAVER